MTPISTDTWNGAGTDNNWSTSGNWVSGSFAANAPLVFAGTTQLAPNNNSTPNTEYDGITFNSGAGAFIIGGNAINLGGDIVNNSTNLADDQHKSGDADEYKFQRRFGRLGRGRVNQRFIFADQTGYAHAHFERREHLQRWNRCHRRQAPHRTDQCLDQRLADRRMSISGNGIVQLADNVTAGTPLGTSNVNLTSLSLTGNGTLDIGNNRIIINYSSPATDPIASIAAWIKNGFYALSGPQIISSDIAADDAASGLSYGIGYADGADGLVAGLPSGEIEIMFTLLGDANLDGTVNSEDFTPFSTNLGQSGSWDDGDFNYDGTVNSEDFTPFSANLGQSATLAAAAGTLESADGLSLGNVPEPASAGMIVMAGLGILNQRRRKARDRR